QLTLGMYVIELDRPWLDSPFLFLGFFIESPDQLAALQECCEHVYIQEDPRLGGEGGSAQAGDMTSPGVRDTAERQVFRQAVRRLLEYRQKLYPQLKKVLEDARLGHIMDSRDTRVLVQQLVELVAVNPQAALWLTNLKDRHSHTADHCFNTTVLSVAFGSHLGMPKQTLEELGLGALLHDVGKMRTPVTVLDKPGVLTEDEFDILKKHPLDGFQMLRKQGGFPAVTLEIVQLHHERVGGQGYPMGLKGEEIPLHVRVVALTEVYDDISSDRVYHDGIPAANCLNMMFHWAPRDFGEDLMQEFIRCIGIYPIGSLVELNTGALGIVMSSNPDSRLKPVVMLVRDREGRPYRRRPLLNLAAPGHKESGFSWQVQRVVDCKDYDIDPARIAEMEARL
ncbi:MAG TPA: HD-GYP domain-containing protein, partial [Gammaproteobacteria bacterium]|nr:HD-GYP domain-containing protein [Gammaproteobacteria bacterium]